MTPNSAVSLNWKTAIDDVGETNYDIYNGKEKISIVDGNAIVQNPIINVAPGLVFGYADGTFKPANKLTRLQ